MTRHIKLAAAPANADADWLCRQTIAECAELIESQAISLREAAWRGSDAPAEVCLRQMIATIKTAAAAFREMGARSNTGSQS
jgi:hypothetical protein